MHPGDGDAVFQPHQFGQHLGTLDHGDSLLVCGENFRVFGAESRGGHNNVRSGDVRRCVSFENGDTQAGQAFSDGRTFQVGPGDAMSKIQQDFGDSAHADTADTDEMHALRADKHLPGAYAYFSSVGSVEK